MGHRIPSPDRRIPLPDLRSLVDQLSRGIQEAGLDATTV